MAEGTSVDPGLARLLLVLRIVGHQGIEDLPARRAGFERFMARLPQPDPLPRRELLLGGIPMEEIAAPVGAEGDSVVLYLHGGGYCLGGPLTHRGLVTRLARAAGARVLVPDYRLAPEHPFPAAFDDALAAFRALAAAEPRTRIALGGDSAGGGLAIAVASAVAAAGERLPVALFALSPWVDLANRAASIDLNARRDLLVDRAGLEAMAALYLAGADAHDPRASPLHGELRRLPPTLIQVGGDECLRDDAVALASALRGAGVAVELEAWPGTVHVGPLYAGLIAAGGEAIEHLARFLRARR